MNKLLRFASFLTLAVSLEAAAGKCLHYDLPEVEITGRLARVEWHSTPTPGTGHRELQESWYFEPAQPLCIAAGPKRLGNVPVRNARRFEVLPPADGSDLGRFLGATVVLRGLFVPTQMPHYHHLTFSIESAKLRHAP